MSTINRIEIPENIMNKLRAARGLQENCTFEDQNILNMTKCEFLNALLRYEGIVGYTTQIMDMIYYAFGIDLESDDIWNEEIERTTEDGVF
jgi:hypothetical protein